MVQPRPRAFHAGDMRFFHAQHMGTANILFTRYRSKKATRPHTPFPSIRRKMHSDCRSGNVVTALFIYQKG